MTHYFLAMSLAANVYFLLYIRKQNYALQNLYAAFVRAAMEAGWKRVVREKR